MNITIIDPTAAVITYLLTTLPLQQACAGCIAAKQKFALPTDAASRQAADSWSFPSRALRVQNAGGVPDIDTSRQVIDLTITAFGSSQADAMLVYRAVGTVLRTMTRVRVELPDAAALLYSLIMINAPTFDFEFLSDQVGIDTVTFTVRATIAECAIP